MSHVTSHFGMDADKNAIIILRTQFRYCLIITGGMFLTGLRVLGSSTLRVGRAGVVVVGYIVSQSCISMTTCNILRPLLYSSVF
jgi:hypothetical protein